MHHPNSSAAGLPPFEQVVDVHGAMVLRVCRAVLGPDPLADDAWSETFLAAMRTYPELRPESNVSGWLATIAHRKAIDQTRRRGRAPVPIGGGPDGSSLDDTDQGLDPALHHAIDQLAPKQRLAVIYRYLADLPYDEIGRLLDSSEVAARRSASDGIARLRVLVESTDANDHTDLSPSERPGATR